MPIFRARFEGGKEGEEKRQWTVTPLQALLSSLHLRRGRLKGGGDFGASLC